MAIKKPKRIEVLSTKMKFIEGTAEEDKVNFEDVLVFMNGRKFPDEYKEYEIKIIDSDCENCIIGIAITGQNKNLPPKRDRTTGVFSKLNLDIEKETLSFGNIFLYDKVLNIFLYEVNVNGCYLDKLITFIQQEWMKVNSDIKFDLSFPSISRKGEYERMLNMTYFKQIVIELTNPTEILQDYKDNKSLLFSTIKRYLKDGVQTNADTMIINLSTFGKRTNRIGLDRIGVLKLMNSARSLLSGTQKKNVKTLTVKGYLTDPNERDTIKPVNLIADTFNIFIRVSVDVLLSDLQEGERKVEIERLYQKYLSEFKYILRRD